MLKGDIRSEQACEWFALCEEPAALLVPHPVLGVVPTCSRCAARFDLAGDEISEGGRS